MTLKPFGDRVLFLEPFGAGGRKASGVFVVHDRRLPSVYGKVTAVHPSCEQVRVGDWIIFAPKRPVKLTYPAGTIYALDEREVLGIVDAGDHRPWFEEAPCPSDVPVHTAGALVA